MAAIILLCLAVGTIYLIPEATSSPIPDPGHMVIPYYKKQKEEQVI